MLVTFFCPPHLLSRERAATTMSSAKALTDRSTQTVRSSTYAVNVRLTLIVVASSRDRITVPWVNSSLRGGFSERKERKVPLNKPAAFENIIQVIFAVDESLRFDLNSAVQGKPTFSALWWPLSRPWQARGKKAYDYPFEKFGTKNSI